MTLAYGKKATRPCPCGHHGSRARACRCTPDAVARYQAKLSGPLLDRIDLQVEVPAVDVGSLAAAADGEPSATVAQRVDRARRRAIARQGCSNAELDAAGVERHCAPAASALQFLLAAAQRFGWSARSHHRVLRVARSIADLGDADVTQTPHVAEAIQLRRVLSAA